MKDLKDILKNKVKKIMKQLRAKKRRRKSYSQYKKCEQGARTGIYPRKLARSVARIRMEREGYSRINRRLSANWQNVIKNYKR